MKKKFLLLLIILICSIKTSYGAGTIATYTIDPVRNAFEHNNKGVVYMSENDYFAAIQEFKIAISLNPKTQATAIYFNNLGNVYMKIGYPQLALDCYQNALTQYNLNFEYYENLAQCYTKLNMAQQQINHYSSSSNILDMIMLGLLYEKMGDKKKAIMLLDEFAMTEPELIITNSVKQHIKKLVHEIRKL